ncbi:GntR family transcriptional regulator [Mangrovibrevibacter kandeliae]|uniref:GntR family transcriptional regulator n=1 Tax=Mangrovibrevibacter kandeliae TaxID=2968473 RepID=UPI0021194FC8|nr:MULTISPECIES: GntR family transcriptional regulator [unclassified Aurantimonas]MCQ8781445.1 GntR family transcriptional regulator [Aurantimonas sp. CSK15Z-1]MCW4114225.1 GntR family transcriptional regulator [Aurantimonas sp. MSK8Z-1]
MNFHIDRDLPVPIRLQLKGLIEYGVACGELKAGEALPSVRDLAERISVAPMTVSQVYRELKAAGVIEARPGSGTFVANTRQARLAARPEAVQLRQHIDSLIDEGLAMGIRASDLASLVNARMFYRASLGRRVSVIMVGLFPEATASYARFIASRLGETATVEPLTVEAIQRRPEVKVRAEAADLAITFVNRQREVAALLPNTKVVSIRFIPSEETRRALASLDPLLKLGVISRFPDFLPIMKAGVQRFAPHVPDITAATLDAPEMEPLIERCDVIVYASGAEGVLQRFGPERPAIEYRHIPDPADIERIVQPLLRGSDDPSSEERQAS